MRRKKKGNRHKHWKRIDGFLVVVSLSKKGKLERDEEQRFEAPRMEMSVYVTDQI